MSKANEAAFRTFHADNPMVYAHLIRLAREGKARGRTKLGIKMLWEVVRWTVYLETSDLEFKLNNDYTSRYARLIMIQERDLAGVFEVRSLRASEAT